MRRQLPKRREKLRQTINQSIATLVELSKKYNPLHFIRALFTENCVGDADTSEPEHEGNEALVEYAQSLATALRDHGKVSPDSATIASFSAHVRAVLEGCTFYFGAGHNADGSTGRADETKFIGMMRHLLIRGSSIREHDTELVSALFDPHEDFFKRNGLFTAMDLIEFCERLFRKSQESLTKAVAAMDQLKALHADFIQATEGKEDAVAESVLREMRESTRAKEAFRALNEALQTPSDFIVYDDQSRVFCDKLSLSPGDNEPFISFSKSPGWPPNDSKIYHKPLLNFDGSYYCPNPVLLLRNRGTILESQIRATDLKYYNEQFAKRRGRLTEELAIRHFSRLLPNGQVFRNMYYRMEQDGENRRFETDGIIIFDEFLFVLDDEFLFVLEMKSAPLSTPALRGANQALANELGHLITEPYRQALRTLKYLKSSQSVSFENEDGTVAIEISEKAFRRIYIVNVTLADIGHVAARLNSARGMGLLSGREWPWSVFVNDLRIISEIVETPAQFLLFLERRLALNDHRTISTQDEIDYLGMFLRDGLYFEAPDLAGVSRLSPHGYTVSIDRYYDHLAGRTTTGEKPRLNITDWYQAFTRNVETSQFPGAVYAAVCLLAMDGTRQSELEQWYKQYSPDTLKTSTPHTFTLISKNGPSFILLIAPDSDGGAIARTRDHARMKRLQTGSEMLVFLALQSSESRPVDLTILEGVIEETPHLRTTVANFKASRVREYVARQGMPPRNDPCPCNSGRKFKKCCYLDISG